MPDNMSLCKPDAKRYSFVRMSYYEKAKYVV